MLDKENHRIHMFNIINAIYDSPLQQNVAFKWGTLCYFMHHLPRFSTDLDFDLLEDDTHFMERMEEILVQFWTIKDKKDKKFTYFFLVSYGAADHAIKIEVSKKKYKSTDYEVINFFGRSIQAMSKGSIFAHKIVALTERFKNRDIFDVWFFFKNWFPINQHIIEERTGKSIELFLQECKKELPHHYNKNTILAEIWDLIDEKQKNFMKTKLVEEVIGMINFYLFTHTNPL